MGCSCTPERDEPQRQPWAPDVAREYARQEHAHSVADGSVRVRRGRCSEAEEEWTVPPVQRFHWDSAAYAEACAAPVRCAGARVYERQLLREICAAFPAASHAIDGGAGGGDLTSLLVEHCQQVYAGEPHPARRVVRATRCPRV